jgi:hypothetical protein
MQILIRKTLRQYHDKLKDRNTNHLKALSLKALKFSTKNRKCLWELSVMFKAFSIFQT